MSILAQNIKLLRQTTGETQTGFAKLLGLKDRMNIAIWERGNAKPKAEAAAKICELFGITSHQLFNERLTVESLKPTGRTKSVLEVELEAAKREIALLKGVIKDKEKIIALLEGK